MSLSCQSQQRELPANRFEIKSPQEMVEIQKGYVPANTSKMPVGLCFDSWCASRNKNAPEAELCPVNLLEAIYFWLSRFVAEVRRQDRKPYPP